MSAALTAAILVIVVGVPLLALLPPRNAPHFVAPAQAGGSVATITWLPAPSTDYYVLQITAGRVVVHASVHPGLSAAVPQDLAPGRYGWRVLPGTGTVAEGTVGTPVARGVFTVGATQAGD